MEILARTYFDYYSVGAVIATVFTFLAGLFALTIPNRSRATFHLGMTLMFMALQNGAYAVAATYYHPFAASHRWVTVFASLLLNVHIIQFVMHYPRLARPRIALIQLISLYIVSFALTIFFVVKTTTSGTVFHFDGHYWDFDADKASAVVAAGLLAMVAVWATIGFYRSFKDKGGDRFALLVIVLALFITAVMVAGLNILNRLGLVGRDVFQTTWNLFTIVSAFIMVVVYMNNTTDRTTFMAKIVGISLVSLLLVMQGVSFFALQAQEKAYDAEHAQKTARAIAAPSFRPPEVAYIKVFENDISRDIYGTPGLDFARYKHEYVNTLYWARIAALGKKNPDKAQLCDQLETVLQDRPVHFNGHAAALLDGCAGLATDSAQPLAELQEYVMGLERSILTRYKKYSKLPPAGYRRAVMLDLNKRPGAFKPYAHALLAELKKSEVDGAEARSLVLSMLAPLHSPATRVYRMDEGEGKAQKHYTAFMFVDQDAKRLHEVGFHYQAYREYVNPHAVMFLIMLLIVLGFVLVGFRFFFLGTLVNPLMLLLSGVRKVNEGDFEVEVPVKTEDEIGFLSRSFNGMVTSIREARDKLKEYADSLEEKVEARTADLNKSLEHVQELKKQQDGDYFLTSLLIKPLGSNRASGERVKVEFLLKQKKQFEFRQWREEIGGDLCIAHTLTLDGRPHTVFLNADAMGKSMQGAGGALVMGAVFESIVERTKLAPEVQARSPERWLKYSFIEMHRIFESFDGSMLMSVVLGALDDETGLLYFMNAEHPSLVLYRNRQASFLEEHAYFRKLGTTGIQGLLMVQTFQLEPGDVVIAGSDGRDDILMGMTDEGVRIINEDEGEFLKRVEEGHGRLEEIQDKLLEQGELTDDLSLLRIGYLETPVSEERRISHEDEAQIQLVKKNALEEIKAERLESAAQMLENALALDNRRIKMLRTIIKLYNAVGDYTKAAEHAETFLKIAPGETRFIYHASRFHMKAGNLTRAAELAERIRIRQPDNTRNLEHLAEIYIRADNRTRAEEIIGTALDAMPNDERMQTKLREILANIRAGETVTETAHSDSP